MIDRVSLLATALGTKPADGLASPGTSRDDALADVAQRSFRLALDFPIVLVIDACDLLIPGGHDPQLSRGSTTGIVDEPGRPDTNPLEAGSQARRGFVRSRQADHENASAQCGNVVRDVGGAAEAPGLLFEANDGHGRFRRNPVNATDDEMIEHQIADDDDGAAGEAGKEVGRIRHAGGVVAAGRPAA